MRHITLALFVVGLAGSAGAGEIVLTSGSRLEGELTNEVILVSTGADLIEVVPEQISVLTPDEITLRDGRILRGTVVGGRLRARTALGELAINLSELRLYRADPAPEQEAAVTRPQAAPAEPPSPSPPAVPSDARPAPRPVPPPAVAPAGPAEEPGGPTKLIDGAKRIGQGVEEVATGVGRTVKDGADRVHDGAKAVGEAVWEAMKSVGRTLRGVFTGSPNRS